MKHFSNLFFSVLFLGVSACRAQDWEAGGAAGGAFFKGVTVSNPAGSASTGFAPGAVLGAMVGQTLSRNLTGEVRYSFRFSDLRVSRGGDEATFQGQTHTFSYELLWHPKPARARVRPFLAVGAGARLFRGTGRESAYQPLASFVLLTKTYEWGPVVSAGAGIKYEISPRVLLRVEVRDYISPFPTSVIAPAPGARLSGWLNDVVPIVGLSYVF